MKSPSSHRAPGSASTSTSSSDSSRGDQVARSPSTNARASSSSPSWRESLHHTFLDMSSWMLGDDTGIAKKIHFQVPAASCLYLPNPKRKNSRSLTSKKQHSINPNLLYCHGMTLIEIQGRAYVQSVEKNSLASQHGIQPRDAIHLMRVLETSTTKQALIADEQKGYRTSYDQIRKIMFLWLLKQQHEAQMAAAAADGSVANVPQTISVGGKRRLPPKEQPSLQSPPPQSTTTSNSSSSEPQEQWFFVICRTQSRLPNTTWWPHFRMDDECRIAASSIVSIPKANPKLKVYGIGFVTCHKVAMIGPSLIYGTGICVAKNLTKGTWSAPCAIGLYGAGLGLQLGIERTQILFVIHSKQALLEFCTIGSLTIGAKMLSSTTSPSRPGAAAASPSAAAASPLSGIFCGSGTVAAFDTDEGRPFGEKEESNNNDYYYHTVAATNPQEYTTASVDTTSLGSNREEEEQQEEIDEVQDGYCTPKTSSSSSPSTLPLQAYVQTTQGLYAGISLEGSKLFVREDVNARVYQFASATGTTSTAARSSDTNTQPASNTNTTTTDTILSGKVAPPPEAQCLYKKLYNLEFEKEWNSFEQKYANPEKASSSIGKTKTTIWQASTKAVSKSTLQQEDVQPIMDLLQGGIPCQDNQLLWLCTTPATSAFQQQDHHHHHGANTCNSLLQLGFLVQPKEEDEDDDEDEDVLLEDQLHNKRQADGDTIVSEDVTLDSAIASSLIMGGAATTASSSTKKTDTMELSPQHSVSLVDVTFMTIDQYNPPRIKFQTAATTLVVEIEHEYAQLVFAGLMQLLEYETNRCGIRGGIADKGKSSKMATHNKYHSPSKLLQGKKKGAPNSPTSTIASATTATTSIQWSRLPGRKILRQIATAHQDGTPKYVHGQLLVRDLAKNVRIPLPLNLARILLLDSNSPLWQPPSPTANNKKKSASSSSFMTPASSSWTFPPATPREQEALSLSITEHQLITTGSMCGAHRTWTYEPQSSSSNKQKSPQHQLPSETHIVDIDDSEQLIFQIQERLPRRGFSTKVKIILRQFSDKDASTEATVLAEVRPIGKNMSNPAMVHKAFLVVLEELKTRYGTNFLLSGFQRAILEDPTYNDANMRTAPANNHSQSSSSRPKDDDDHEEKKEDSIKIQDMFQENASLAKLESHDARRRDDRRPTPRKDRYGKTNSKGGASPRGRSAGAAADTFDHKDAGPVMIEVKPLPKIRLSLMPSPREEDEDLLDENGDPINKKKSVFKKKKKSSSRSRSRGRRSGSSSRSNGSSSRSKTSTTTTPTSSSSSSSRHHRGLNKKSSF